MSGEESWAKYVELTESVQQRCASQAEFSITSTRRGWEEGGTAKEQRMRCSGPQDTVYLRLVKMKAAVGQYGVEHHGRAFASDHVFIDRAFGEPSG